MITKKHLMVLLSGTLLLILTGCGKDNHKSNKQVAEANPICEGVNCLTTVNWRILLPGRVFPARVKVDINGATVLNECVAKQKYMIDRNSNPEMLYLDNYIIPKKGGVKILIHDLGQCDSYAKFIENNDASFDFLKSGTDQEIIINL